MNVANRQTDKQTNREVKEQLKTNTYTDACCKQTNREM